MKRLTESGLAHAYGRSVLPYDEARIADDGTHRSTGWATGDPASLFTLTFLGYIFGQNAATFLDGLFAPSTLPVVTLALLLLLTMVGVVQSFRRPAATRARWDDDELTISGTRELSVPWTRLHHVSVEGGELRLHLVDGSVEELVGPRLQVASAKLARVWTARAGGWHEDFQTDAQPWRESTSARRADLLLRKSTGARPEPVLGPSIRLGVGVASFFVTMQLWHVAAVVMPGFADLWSVSPLLHLATILLRTAFVLGGFGLLARSVWPTMAYLHPPAKVQADGHRLRVSNFWGGVVFEAPWDAIDHITYDETGFAVHQGAKTTWFTSDSPPDQVLALGASLSEVAAAKVEVVDEAALGQMRALVAER